MNDPRFDRTETPTQKKGDRNIVDIIFFIDQDGGDHESTRDLSYSFIEVEENKVDVEFEDLREIMDSFDNYGEEYPCGAPADIDEQIQDRILNDVRKVLGRNWSIRNFNNEPFKPL